MTNEGDRSKGRGRTVLKVLGGFALGVVCTVAVGALVHPALCPDPVVGKWYRYLSEMPEHVVEMEFHEFGGLSLRFKGTLFGGEWDKVSDAYHIAYYDTGRHGNVIAMILGTTQRHEQDLSLEKGALIPVITEGPFKGVRLPGELKWVRKADFSLPGNTDSNP